VKVWEPGLKGHCDWCGHMKQNFMTTGCNEVRLWNCVDSKGNKLKLIMLPKSCFFMRQVTASMYSCRLSSSFVFSSFEKQ
jgi:hypothetical protein